VRAWALLRFDVAEGLMDLSGTYLGVGEAAEAANGFGAKGRWGSWRAREDQDLVTADWVLAEGSVTWFIVPTEVHPALGWWAVERAMHLVRDCLRAIARGRTR
jgi:hypothetical protein